MIGPSLIILKTIPDPARGLLCVAEIDDHIPFVVKRFFTLNNMKEGAFRGNHAHRAQSQYFNAVHGAFDVLVEGASGNTIFKLNNPDHALNVPPLHWVTITSTLDGSTMLCCASDKYDEKDYIYDRSEFKSLIQPKA